jgi:hypothetical protein
MTQINTPSLVIVAGDCGVYAGYVAGGAAACTSTSVALTRARHLRRYYVAGRTGDGSVSDLASRGLDPTSPSISDVVPGVTMLHGVRRVLDVVPEVAPSFSCGE